MSVAASAKAELKEFLPLVRVLPGGFEHLVMSRFLETVDHAMLANGFLFLGTGTWHAAALGAGDHAPLFRKIGVVRSFFRWRIIFCALNSWRACLQSASVNSLGLRSSIIAISLARFSTSSGDGAPRPFPCTEIFPRWVVSNHS
jgi:hypothetical protein